MVFSKIKKTLILLVLVGQGIKASPQPITSTPTITQSHELKNFAAIKTLSHLHSAFFKQPEFVGDFRSRNKNKPSPQQKCVSAKTLQDAAERFYSMYANENLPFFDQESWLGKAINPDENSYDTIRYVQKIKVDPTSTVCIMGDFHGSMHSLMRNLLRLKALGFLNEDLSIKNKNFYMVFLGDYVDRGSWSAEVLVTLMKLKLQNWHQVTLIAGNHEFKNIAQRFGFQEELICKFGNIKGNELFEIIDQNFFRTLPVAAFIKCNGTFIQCCHGGITTQYNPKNFLEQPDKLFENVGPKEHCKGLFWSDFCAGNHGTCQANFHRGFTDSREAIIADQKYTQKYLKNNNLKAIIRAHQDSSFGLKLFYNAEKIVKDTEPFHWTDVLKSLGVFNNKFSLSLLDYYPVFTFSSAVEAREFPYDCFGLINTESSWDKWMMEVYEIFLGKNGNEIDRHGKYVHISSNPATSQTELVTPSRQPKKDPINVSWTPSPTTSFKKPLAITLGAMTFFYLATKLFSKE